MHKFTDSSVDEYYVKDGEVTLFPVENWGYLNLSKEDLLYLLKLIEEEEIN